MISKNIQTNTLKDLFITDEELQKLQKVELGILSEMVDSCRKRNIPLYIMHGTLLGAIRHKGFIPWDDDIDTVAFIDDVPKIVEAMQEDYPGKYDFEGILFDQGKSSFFATKVYLKGTIATEVAKENYPGNQAIFTDIFFIIPAPATLKKQHKQMNKISFWRHIGALAFEFKYPPTFLLKHKGRIGHYYRFRRVLGFLCRPWYKTSRKKIMKQYTKYKGSGYYRILDIETDKPLTKEFFMDVAQYEFENILVPSVKEGIYLVESQYGKNYMTLPPIEKRERHVALKFDLGKYDPNTQKTSSNEN